MSTCTPRLCAKGKDCMPYAQPCKTVKDCLPTSCCVVLDLDIIDSNIPARSLPEASIQTCNATTDDLYCNQVCARTNPAWSQFITRRDD